MNREAMKQQILEALSKKLGDGFHLSIQKVLKTNVRLDGLTIGQEGETISPIVYMEPFYESLEKGISIDTVTDRILNHYYLSKFCSGYLDIPSLPDLSHIKNRLYVELVNRHLNRELMKDIPHALFLDDFAVTIRCLLNVTENGSVSFLIHNSHLNLWQTDWETLISHALYNTRKMLGVHLEMVDDFLHKNRPEMRKEDIPKAPLWMMTNHYKLSGAATVLFNDKLAEFSKEHGNFYVIFSSVNEALLIPESSKFDASFLTRTNQVINATEVQADEILGTKAYYYSRDKGFIY